MHSQTGAGIDLACPEAQRTVYHTKGMHPALPVS